MNGGFSQQARIESQIVAPRPASTYSLAELVYALKEADSAARKYSDLLWDRAGDPSEIELAKSDKLEDAKSDAERNLIDRFVAMGISPEDAKALVGGLV